jgi:uncharacterized protein YukE
MSSLNLTPAALATIIHKMDVMSNEINSAALELKKATERIKTTWDDNQYQMFSDRMKSIITELEYMSDDIVQEKERVVQYQKDTQNAADNY